MRGCAFDIFLFILFKKNNQSPFFSVKNYLQQSRGDSPSLETTMPFWWLLFFPCQWWFFSEFVLLLSLVQICSVPSQRQVQCRELSSMISRRDRAESDHILHLDLLLFMELSKWLREVTKTYHHEFLHHGDMYHAWILMPTNRQRKVLLVSPFPNHIFSHSSVFQHS